MVGILIAFQVDRWYEGVKDARLGALNFNEHQQLPYLTDLWKMWFICPSVELYTKLTLYLQDSLTHIARR